MTSSQDTPLPLRIAEFYKELASTASALNAASDELGKSISALDAVLAKLNLGIACWVCFLEWEDGPGGYIRREVGYARIDRRWGIALRTVSGHESYPDQEKEEAWFFNDAPRAHRIEAVDHLPALFEKLIHEAQQTTESIRAKTELAKGLSSAINDAVIEVRAAQDAERVARLARAKEGTAGSSAKGTTVTQTAAIASAKVAAPAVVNVKPGGDK